MYIEPELTGFTSKLTKNTAWVRLNYTRETYPENTLLYFSFQPLATELEFRGRADEAKTVREEWVVDKIKYYPADAPINHQPMTTALVYMKKIKK